MTPRRVRAEGLLRCWGLRVPDRVEFVYANVGDDATFGDVLRLRTSQMCHDGDADGVEPTAGAVAAGLAIEWSPAAAGDVACCRDVTQGSAVR